MNKTSIEKAVSGLGWDLAHAGTDQTRYRAMQGRFVTPWRDTKEEVLADIKELSRIEEALDAAESKLR